MTGQIDEQISCFEPVSLVFRFEKFLGQGFLTVFPEVGGGDIPTGLIRHGFGEGFMLPVSDRGHIDIGTAVQKAVVAPDTCPQIGLQIESRFLKPQRFGVVDGGLGADEKTGFIVLLDGVAPEPVFDAGVVVVEPPEGLGRGLAVGPQAEDSGDALGQSEALKLVQKTFKEARAKTC